MSECIRYGLCIKNRLYYYVRRVYSCQILARLGEGSSKFEHSREATCSNDLEQITRADLLPGVRLGDVFADFLDGVRDVVGLLDVDEEKLVLGGDRERSVLFFESLSDGFRPELPKESVANELRSNDQMQVVVDSVRRDRELL